MFVAPAKAGAFVRERLLCRRKIPAFAGMTTVDHIVSAIRKNS